MFEEKSQPEVLSLADHKIDMYHTISAIILAFSNLK